jgi:pyruvyl transferase EpsO
MDMIKEKLQMILRAIPPGSKIYYIDYPVYGNGGDLLIMKGAEKFFADNRIKVLRRFSVLDFPKNLTIGKDIIIVLNGGGNFGDLYPLHQGLREHIVSRYHSNRIVVLPQTIYYKDEREYDKTARIFNQHPDLHLFTRDTGCYELAKKKFKACQVYLSPDMAHQLWPMSSNNEESKDILYFLRTDIETDQAQQALMDRSSRDYYDWTTLFTKLNKKGITLFLRMYTVRRKTGIRIPVARGWYLYSDYLINKAVRLFGGYRMIHTSRLHGHILSCLMDKQNILIDNSYGKNSSYYYTWTHQCGNTELYLKENVSSH